VTILDKLDMSQRLDQKQYATRLVREQRRLLQLRLHLGGQMGTSGPGPGLLVVFEGPDASGKGGAIKVVVGHLDPRHYKVLNCGVPSAVEKRHHFLWRFYPDIPGLGGMSVFDRSWYGRVLVERIEGYATEREWGRGYQSIVDFERSLVLEGVILVKFWMQISDAEQLRRFEARQADPLKRWKLTPEDWRNRDRNADYAAAAEDVFEHTHHELGPWDVIAAEQKRFGRIAVLETLNNRIEHGLSRAGYPVPHIDDLLDDTEP
jgi:polyphosphate kinase 2 (PPK2 family)